MPCFGDKIADECCIHIVCIIHNAVVYVNNIAYLPSSAMKPKFKQFGIDISCAIQTIDTFSNITSCVFPQQCDTSSLAFDELPCAVLTHQNDTGGPTNNLTYTLNIYTRFM